MKRRPSYPRINCLVPGCKRGTTTFPPNTTMICGKCWRKAPKDIRQRWSKWRRRRNAFAKRGEHRRAEICDHAGERLFWRIFHIITGNDDSSEGELPPLLAEELRKIGL